MMVSGRKAYDASKVSNCCLEKARHFHIGAVKYSLPNSHKSSLTLNYTDSDNNT